MHFHGRTEFLKNVEGSLRMATQMVEYLENYLGLRYPLPKLDIVALPEYKGRAPADHLGLIMFK
jgi:Aminopeptidase N